MALPQLTDEQRANALAKAKEVRAQRASLKKKIAAGQISFSELFTLADNGDMAAAKLKITDALRAMPGIGKVKAQQILESQSISPTRSVKGLGSRQRANLIEMFG